jgi:hypothetical protein
LKGYMYCLKTLLFIKASKHLQRSRHQVSKHERSLPLIFFISLWDFSAIFHVQK